MLGSRVTGFRVQGYTGFNRRYGFIMNNGELNGNCDIMVPRFFEYVG